MNKLLRTAGVFLLVLCIVLSLAACGQRAVQQTAQEENKEIVVETPPASPTPAATPTPSVPPVAVTTVPMPMPSVSPTVAVTTPEEAGTAAGTPAAPAGSPAVSPSPSVAPSPTPTPYSADANFASTIRPDGVNMPANTIKGRVSANGVNFRAGPSESARIIATYDSGTALEILAYEGDWAEVLINGTTGYIKSTYVSTSGNVVSLPSSGSSDGSTLIIVPDGQVSGHTTVTPSQTTVGTDIYGGVPIS